MREVNEHYACDHPETEIRVKTTVNNQKQYRRQCLECGCMVGEIMKQSQALLELNGQPAGVFDDELKTRWSEERRTIKNTEYQEKKRAENAEWWERYSEYLKSETWQMRRSKVLLRDGYKCQACLLSKATQVHHLTYDHVFTEPAFDLISVCSECHDKLTELDRARRQGVEL